MRRGLPGRTAYSHENRVGQAWAEQMVQVIGQCGSSHKLFDAPIGHRKCHCLGVIRVEEHGWAECEHCGEVYNYNGDKPKIIISNRSKKRSLERFKYEAMYKSY